MFIVFSRLAVIHPFITNLRLLNQSIKILVNATFPTDQYLVLKPNNLMLLQKLSVMYVANCQPLTEYDKVSYHNYNPSRSDLI